MELDLALVVESFEVDDQLIVVVKEELRIVNELVYNIVIILAQWNLVVSE